MKHNKKNNKKETNIINYKCFECGTQDSFDNNAGIPQQCPNCGEMWIKVKCLDKE